MLNFSSVLVRISGSLVLHDNKDDEDGSRDRTPTSMAALSTRPIKIPHPTSVARAEYLAIRVRRTGGKTAPEMLQQTK